jgi:hypothetical protein
MIRCYPIPGLEHLGPLPSVTTVLSETYNKGRYGKIMPNSQFGKNVKFRADVGTAVHKLSELYLKGEPLPHEILDSFDKEPRMLFEQLAPIIKGLNIYRGTSGKLCIEKITYSVKLLVAGRVDLVVQSPSGALEIWDLKTAGSRRTKEQIHGYFLQASAYAQCVREITGLPVSRCVLLFAYVNKNNPYTEELSIEGPAIDRYLDEFAEYRRQFTHFQLA